MSASIATVLTAESFEENSSEYYATLFRTVLRLTGDQEEAEDLAQTAFVRFLRLMTRKQWDLEIDHVQAYLTRIARNLVNDRWREKGKEKAVSYDDDKTREAVDRETAQTDESVVTMDNRIYFKELYRTLPNVILAGMSQYEEQIFLLRRIEELSLREVADTVGKEICKVRYDLQKVEARIRYRARKIIGEDKAC